MKAAIAQFIRGTRYGITQAKAELATLSPQTTDEFYHQGYQNGRVAEMERAADTMAMAMIAAGTSTQHFWRYDCGIYQGRVGEADYTMIAAAKNVHVAQRIVDALNEAVAR